MARFKRKKTKNNRFIKLWRKIFNIEVKQELIARKFTGSNAAKILKWMYPMLITDDVEGLTVSGKQVKPGMWIVQGEQYYVWKEKKLFKLYNEVPPEKYDDEKEFAKSSSA